MDTVLTFMNIVLAAIGMFFIVLLLSSYWSKGSGSKKSLEYASGVGAQFISILVKIFPFILVIIMLYFAFF